MRLVSPGWIAPEKKCDAEARTTEMSAEPSKHAVTSRPMALKHFRRLMRAASEVLQARYGGHAALQISEETREEFERLIPEIPYVGGRRNPSTELLINTAGILSFHRVLKRHGVQGEEFAEVLQESTVTYMESYPVWLRRLMGRIWMSRWLRRFMHGRARISQQRRYDGEFVYEVVPEDGAYEWGIDYLECGILKFLQSLGETELMDAMCELDHIMFPALGVSLRRTQTLAQGCERCNFRFRRL